MANIITRSEYQTISENISSAAESLDAIPDFIYDNVYTVALSDQVQPTVDLVTALFNDYNKNVLLANSSSTFLTGIRALNSHVILRGNHATVNDYLDSTSPQLTVPAKFASLSTSAGYPINNLATDVNAARTRIVG